MTIFETIESLIAYAEIHLDLPKEDITYVRNQLYDILNIDEPKIPKVNKEQIKRLEEPSSLLDGINQYKHSVQQFNAKIMDLLIPRPSQVISHLNKLSSKEKTNYLYDLSIKSNYIRKREIDKNIIWKYPNLIITINLSKPEIIQNKKKKNNKEKEIKKIDTYPKCPLCIENVGFHGNETKETRQNLRVMPITLNNESWYFQYSPYVYYKEHCIIFSENHVPMKITKDTFKRLLDFIDQFPHYFIGSNAGLPRIGGSILSHDHYQGGNYTFPLQKAKLKKEFKHPKYKDVRLGIVNWYNSVIRLESTNKDSIIKLTNHIYQKWLNYNNNELDIISKTDEIHNGITPIVHKEGNKYVMNIILRNNRTSHKHPEGIFHAHRQYHHIKKEGIGLIEAMGMFILPARLEKEIKKENITKNEIHDVCINILKNTAVFKDDEKGQKGLYHFINSLLY